MEGKGNIDSFYAPQLKPGMVIKIKHINDKNYTLVY